MALDALLVGCGDLGARIGRLLADRGHDVLALRRRADLVPLPLHGRSVDLTRHEPDLTELEVDVLVVALTARPRSVDAYRATYVEGLTRVIDALDAAGQRPRRAVLVSSTGVFGDLDGPVDESMPAQPADGPAAVLLDAERLFLDRVPDATVLRCSGLYDPTTSTRLVDQVRAGEIGDPHRWTNRIHRDDAASAVTHLLSDPARPGPLYVATDDEPTQLGVVATHLASRLPAAPAPPQANPGLGHGKQLSNALLRSTGWVPRYPTFREGYAV